VRSQVAPGKADFFFVEFLPGYVSKNFGCYYSKRFIVNDMIAGRHCMASRRNFLLGTSAVALLGSVPLSAWSSASRQIQTRLIPGTNESLPIIGLGNSKAFMSGDRETSSAVLNTFLEHGGAYVDVSGSSRFTVGGILADKAAQERSFLGNYLSGQNLSELRLEIRELQGVQGEGPLDLTMKRDVADLSKRADEFRALKEEGLARYVGIGRPHKRFYPAMMKLMEDGVVDFIQVNYSMLEPEAADEIIPMAMDKGVAVVINRPFINGDFFGVIRGHELPDWAAEFDCASWAQFSLKYIVSQPGVNCVLTETTNPKHVVDNLGAGFGRLPDPKTREKMRTHLQSLT
jgi:aryl-alcohol dehydrogenase-like predicted oxidoreductase